jgi:hypothetical protein
MDAAPPLRHSCIAMLVVALSSIIQQAAADPRLKNLSGNVRAFDELLKPEHLRDLEAQHPGIFAFLAFHPGADEAIADYVRQGSLGSDSGPSVMVLFTLDSRARWPKAVGAASFASWLQVDAGEHPAYEMVRMLFAGRPSPILPGIAFFEALSGEHNPVYASMDQLRDPQAVRQWLRLAFSRAEEAHRAAGGVPGTCDRLAAALARHGVPYQRPGSTSLREWLARAYRLADQHKGDIVAVAKLGIDAGKKAHGIP